MALQGQGLGEPCSGYRLAGQAMVGCMDYQGPLVPVAAMEPALQLTPVVQEP